MKKYLFMSLLLVLAFFGANLADARGKKRLCSGENATIECLKENFKDLYEGQYYQFLIIIAKAEKEALSCKSPEDTAAYLDIALRIGDNLEVEDGFKDILETKFLKDKAVCFLDALLRTDDSVKEIILGKYLTKPRYIKKMEVDDILSRYVEQERYKEMLKHYSGK